jgi:hypothetical protein
MVVCNIWYLSGLQAKENDDSIPLMTTSQRAVQIQEDD